MVECDGKSCKLTLQWADPVVPFVSYNKTFKFRVEDTVWIAKQAVLLEFSSLNLTDPLNYGFYMPPFKGKAGKFLDEERPLRDYPVESYGDHLEFRYKRRIYRALNMDEKKLQKYQSKSYQKKFLEYIMTGNNEKAKRLLEKGLDPNFQVDSTGETPLTALIMLPHTFEACMMLVNYSAYLDYRSADGMTAMHRAMIHSRADSISFLLDLGASPNYKDAKGLTALWHGIQTGATDHCCELLLNERAILGACDQQGSQEIHLACRKGYDKHLDHLIFYGADLNCRTATGNTPLHICAIGGQENCARILLFRGADKTAVNYANQTAYETAIVSGNNEVAALIDEFDVANVTPFLEKPVYSRRRRERTAPSKQNPQKSSDAVPVHSELIRSVTVANKTDLDNQKNKEAMFLKISKKTSTGNLSNNNLPTERKAPDTDDSASDLSDSDDENAGKHKKIDRRTFSTGAFLKKAPAPMKSGPGTKAQLKSRLYPSIPGRQFVAVVDYHPKAPGELALEKGDAVDVLYIGEQGFWEGRVNDRTGWFPSSCLQELKKTTKKENNRTWFGKKSGQKNIAEKCAKPDMPTPRTVHLRKGDKGYGFQLRGANSYVVRIEFKPKPDFPALQYIGEVDKLGAADKAGLKPGDFVLEVNGEDVRNATHGYVVSLVANTGNALTLKIVTVLPQSLSPDFSMESPKLHNATQSKAKEDKPQSKDGKKVPPPPLPRSQYSSMTVGHLSGGTSLTEVHIPGNVDTVMTLDKKVQRKRSVKSMWSDTALKLHPDAMRTEEISKGVVRKTKGLSMPNVIDEKSDLQRTSSVSSRSSASTQNVSNASPFATLPRKYSRSSSVTSDETASSDSANRPQQPPGYEATLEHMRRIGRKPSFQRSDSERKLLASAHPTTNSDNRSRTDSTSSDVFPPPPTFIPTAPCYSPPAPPVEETQTAISRSLSTPAQPETVPHGSVARTVSEPAQNSQSSDEEEPTSDFALALKKVVSARKQRNRSSKLSIDETVALRRKEQGLHVIKENETVASSSMAKSSNPDVVPLTKSTEHHSLYAASSTSSLDTQISKDSGIDVSDVMGQAPGEQPPDLASALANAVARRAEKIAKKESVTKPPPANAIGLQNQPNVEQPFLGVKLKTVRQEPIANKPESTKQIATPPPTRPKPQSRMSAESINVASLSISSPVSSVPALTSSPSLDTSTPVVASPEPRPDIVTPPLMFASNDNVNETIEGQLDAVDGPPVESPKSPMPPPPDFIPDSYQTEMEKTQTINGRMTAVDPPPPYSPPRVKSDLPSTISSKPYPEWTSEDVGFWLDFINMGQYKESFLENDIQGVHLADLSKDDLSELGVKKLGHRLTIDDAIGKLRNQLQFSEV